MYTVEAKCKKGKIINKLKTFIHKVSNKKNDRNEEVKKHYNKEERINMIKNKLKDIEESVLIYK